MAEERSNPAVSCRWCLSPRSCLGTVHPKEISNWSSCLGEDSQSTTLPPLSTLCVVRSISAVPCRAAVFIEICGRSFVITGLATPQNGKGSPGPQLPRVHPKPTPKYMLIQQGSEERGSTTRSLLPALMSRGPLDHLSLWLP